MRELNIEVQDTSSLTFESLEAYAREQIQGWLQQLLEEEITELLGRERHERREAGDAEPGYRNGYGKPRQVATTMGTITVRRPRVRQLEVQFESRVLPLFVRQTKEVGQLLPELYLHGLSQGDFDLALRGLLGEGASLSGSSIARLKERWQAQYEAWKQRGLEGEEIVYLWVDGIYLKAGIEKEKACLLVAIGVRQDGRKVLLSLECGYRESKESWAGLLRSLRDRGLASPKLVIGDGHLGIWSALGAVYPQAKEQRCWNHRIVNVLDRIPKSQQASGKELLRQVANAQSQAQMEQKKREFEAWCQQKGYEAASRLLSEDWERMGAFLSFPKAHWKHLRTTNVVESPFATVRLRTDAAKRYKKAENATAVVWKLLRLAEQRFQRLSHPHLLKEVAAGTRYIDGVAATEDKPLPA